MWGRYLRGCLGLKVEVISLLDTAFRLSSANQKTLAQQWVDLSKSTVVTDFFPSFAPETQWVGQLDVLLREMENEFSSAYSAGVASNLPLMSYGTSLHISQLWVSGAYELFRSVILRMRSPDQKSVKSLIYKRFFRELEILRVQLFKSEIAGYRSADDGPVNEVILSLNQPFSVKAYEHGTSLATPTRSIRQSDGSVSWTVYDVKKRTQITIYRRDLSDKILTYFQADEAPEVSSWSEMNL